MSTYLTEVQTSAEFAGTIAGVVVSNRDLSHNSKKLDLSKARLRKDA